MRWVEPEHDALWPPVLRQIFSRALSQGPKSHLFAPESLPLITNVVKEEGACINPGILYMLRGTLRTV